MWLTRWKACRCSLGPAACNAPCRRTSLPFRPPAIARSAPFISRSAASPCSSALPAFIALNEPETSLHPDLLEPLARMVARASDRTQVWQVTHSERHAAAIAEQGGRAPRRVIKREAATWIEGLRMIGDFGEDDEE